MRQFLPHLCFAPKTPYFFNMTSLKKSIEIILLLALLYFSVLMINLTLPYLALEDNVAFLRIKRAAREITIWKLAFYIHVFTSIFLLIAGFTQFSNNILRGKLQPFATHGNQRGSD